MLNDEFEFCDENVYESTSYWHASSPINIDLKKYFGYFQTIGKQIIFKKDEVIFKQGEYIKDIYIIQKGLIKYYLNTQDGKGKIVGYSDNFIRLDGVFHKQPISSNVIAMTDIDALVIPRSYLNIILHNIDIAQIFLEALSREVRVLGWQIFDACLLSNKEKICRVLYVSKNKEQNNQYNVYLKQQEIADMCGIHRVTVTKALLELQKENIVYLKGKGIINIIDMQELKLLGFGSIY